MSAEENKDLARRSWEIVKQRNPDLVEEFYPPEFVWHEPDQDIRGYEQAKQFVSTFFTAFPDISITVECGKRRNSFLFVESPAPNFRDGVQRSEEDGYGLRNQDGLPCSLAMRRCEHREPGPAHVDEQGIAYEFIMADHRPLRLPFIGRNETTPFECDSVADLSTRDVGARVYIKRHISPRSCAANVEVCVRNDYVCVDDY